jgi:hypothetical protein
MSRILVKLRRGEKGQALILAMILLFVGCLIVVSLLVYTGSGIKVGKDVHEERMNELYAADSGVVNSMWYLQNIGRLKTLIQKEEPWYTPPDSWDTWIIVDYPWEDEDSGFIDYELGDINGKQVGVIVDYFPYDTTFHITSTGSSVGSFTTIDAYFEILDLSPFLGNAITSDGDVTVKSPSELSGDIQCPEDPIIEKGVIWDGGHNDDSISWPSADDLRSFYLEDVDDLPPPYDNFPEDSMDVADVRWYPVMPALYREGSFEIENSEKGVVVAFESLTDVGERTMYIDGDLVFAQQKQEFTLDMNGQVIFVDGDITGGSKLDITGSGCIIAVGNIDLQPHFSSQEGDFLLIMSVEGNMNIQPQENSQLYGCLAGNVSVLLHPNCTLKHVDPEGKDFNFPWEGYSGGKLLSILQSWEINLD